MVMCTGSMGGALHCGVHVFNFRLWMSFSLPEVARNKT